MLLGLVKLLTVFACTPILDLYPPVSCPMQCCTQDCITPHHRPPVKELLTSDTRPPHTGHPQLTCVPLDPVA
jgi:hypothetical protein